VYEVLPNCVTFIKKRLMKNQFAYTNASDITFVINNSAGVGTITVKLSGVTQFTINKDSGTRRWSVTEDAGVKTFTDEPGVNGNITSNWPTFLLPFSTTHGLTLVSSSKTGHLYGIVGTDDIRNNVAHPHVSAHWDIYNVAGSADPVRFIDIRVKANTQGPGYVCYVYHSYHTAMAAPDVCDELSCACIKEL
jgi:hypothetical protein